MKLSIIIIGLFIVAGAPLNGQSDRIIELEVKHHCQCYQSFQKKAAKKAKRAAQKGAKKKKYRPGIKLFGGEDLVFNLGDCVDKKRSTKTATYIDELSQEAYEQLKKSIENRLGKVAPPIII